ncbi:MAG: hypothetical protein D6785_12315 [Planctomycetota bacterium]|nr:MAG: hypothetical protein D6785_12315 [Planctomycetota bacterium]
MSNLGEKKGLLIFLGIIAVVVIGGGIYFFKAWKDIKQKRAQLQKLKTDINTLSIQIAEKPLKQLEAKLKEVGKMVRDFRKILPNKGPKEEDNLLTYLSNLRINSGLYIAGKFSTLPAQKAEQNLGVERLRYNMTLEGTFKRFLLFLKQVESPSRLAKFIIVDNFKIVPTVSKGGQGKKKFIITLSSFYYNPQTELAQQAQK